MVPRLTHGFGSRPRPQTARWGRALFALALALALAIASVLAIDVNPVAAAPIANDQIGINVQPYYKDHTQLEGLTDLATASASGVGIARIQLIQGGNNDQLVSLAAQAHLRVYPMLGLSQQDSPSAAASAMAQYVTAFAQRYGPNGTFWSQNPQLPYLPVQEYEIGNEPNMPLQYVQDSTNLHWTDPSSYAEVYNASRNALHDVDPTGIAVVGGLADTDAPGVDLASDEEWLAALPVGGVDAVGFHMYPTSTSLLESDTASLRQWMNDNGFQNVPIDVNEMDACDSGDQGTNGCMLSTTSADWGSATAQFAQWALCTPGLNVSNVQVFYWGDIPITGDPFLPLVTNQGNVTQYGQDYLSESHILTTDGCPPENSSLPTVGGTTVVGQSLTSTAGSWNPAPSAAVGYQWSRCDSSGQNCTSVPGATSATYQVQSGDAGHRLVVSVTATNAVGSNTASSLPTAVVTASSADRSAKTARHHRRRRRRRRAGAVGANVASLRRTTHFRIAWMRAKHRRLTVAVRVKLPAPQVGVEARGRNRHVRLRVAYRKPSSGSDSRVVVFTGRLAPGTWAIRVACVSRCGGRSPGPVWIRVRVPSVMFAW